MKRSLGGFLLYFAWLQGHSRFAGMVGWPGSDGMNENSAPQEKVEKSRHWKWIYLGIVALTIIVYLLLWLFSQAFLR